jgi:hypothetical protein
MTDSHKDLRNAKVIALEAAHKKKRLEQLTPTSLAVLSGKYPLQLVSLDWLSNVSTAISVEFAVLFAFPHSFLGSILRLVVHLSMLLIPLIVIIVTVIVI